MAPYFERQQLDSKMCAVHCLNNTLQYRRFTSSDLVAIAGTIDEDERTLLRHREMLENPNGDIDGIYSIQVIEFALRMCGMHLVPFDHPDEDQFKIDLETAFICHKSCHWLCIRKVEDNWYTLDSLLSEPWTHPSEEPISSILKNMRKTANIFIVRRNLLNEGSSSTLGQDVCASMENRDTSVADGGSSSQTHLPEVVIDAFEFGHRLLSVDAKPFNPKHQVQQACPGGAYKNRLSEGQEPEVYKQGSFKTELCKWHEMGVCHNGEQCHFAHGSSELRSIIRDPHYKTEACSYVVVGKTCPFAHRCHFAHDSSELRSITRDPLYKTEACSYVLAGKTCPFAHRCHFCHDVLNR